MAASGAATGRTGGCGFKEAPIARELVQHGVRMLRIGRKDDPLPDPEPLAPERYRVTRPGTTYLSGDWFSNQVLWDSGDMKPGDKPEKIDIDIRQTESLLLEFKGKGAHGCWAGARAIAEE